MAALSNARTRHAEPVYLNVYDLSPMNDYTFDIGFGIYHSGIQVHGDEWTFSTSGVFYHRPQKAPNVKFRTQVLLGTVNYTSSKVKDVINSLRDEFQGERYHLLNNNCNCFSERLSVELLNKPIPGYVNRLASIGSSISCLIPKSLLGYPLWGLQRRGDDTYLDPYNFSVLFGVREKHIRYLVQDELIDGETSDPSNLHAQDLLIPTTEILNFSYQPCYWRGCIGK